MTNRSRRSPVVVMKPAEHGEGDDLPGTGWRGPSHRGQGALTQTLMRADAIKIANVLRQSREEVALVQDDHVVQAFAPHAPEKSLTDGVHVRRPDGSLDDPRSEGLGGAVEVGAELTVPVADDETRSFAERRCRAKLLGSPLLAGSPRYRHVHDFARSDIDDEKGEDWPKPDVVGLDEIARPDVPAVVFEEGCPALAGRVRLHIPLEIALDRALGDSNSELEQLAPDALRAPKAIFTGHPTDELDGLDRDTGLRRLLIARAPSPEHLKSLPMPAQDRLGLHEKHRFAPSAAERARDHHSGAVESGEIRALDLSPEDEQLLRQQHVFGEQESAWSEQVGD